MNDLFIIIIEKREIWVQKCSKFGVYEIVLIHWNPQIKYCAVFLMILKIKLMGTFVRHISTEFDKRNIFSTEFVFLTLKLH